MNVKTCLAMKLSLLVLILAVCGKVVPVAADDLVSSSNPDDQLLASSTDEVELFLAEGLRATSSGPPVKVCTGWPAGPAIVQTVVATLTSSFGTTDCVGAQPLDQGVVDGATVVKFQINLLVDGGLVVTVDISYNRDSKALVLATAGQAPNSAFCWEDAFGLNGMQLCAPTLNATFVDSIFQELYLGAQLNVGKGPLSFLSSANLIESNDQCANAAGDACITATTSLSRSDDGQWSWYIGADASVNFGLGSAPMHLHFVFSSTTVVAAAEYEGQLAPLQIVADLGGQLLPGASGNLLSTLNLEAVQLSNIGAVIIYDSSPAALKFMFKGTATVLDLEATIELAGSASGIAMAAKFGSHGLQQAIAKITGLDAGILSFASNAEFSVTVSSKKLDLSDLADHSALDAFPDPEVAEGLVLTAKFALPSSCSGICAGLQMLVGGAELVISAEMNPTETILFAGVSDITVGHMLLVNAGVEVVLKSGSASVALTCGLALNVNGRPLTFTGRLEIAPGQISATFTMEGIWEQAFGSDRLSIANVIIGVGITPPIVPSYLQLGGEVTIGLPTKCLSAEGVFQAAEGCMQGTVSVSINLVDPTENCFYASVKSVTVGNVAAAFLDLDFSLPAPFANSGYEELTVSYAAIEGATLLDGTAVPMGSVFAGVVDILGLRTYMKCVYSPITLDFTGAMSSFVLGPLSLTRNNAPDAVGMCTDTGGLNGPCIKAKVEAGSFEFALSAVLKVGTIITMVVDAAFSPDGPMYFFGYGNVFGYQFYLKYSQSPTSIVANGAVSAFNIGALTVSRVGDCGEGVPSDITGPCMSLNVSPTGYAFQLSGKVKIGSALEATANVVVDAARGKFELDFDAKLFNIAALQMEVSISVSTSIGNGDFSMHLDAGSGCISAVKQAIHDKFLEAQKAVQRLINAANNVLAESLSKVKGGFTTELLEVAEGGPAADPMDRMIKRARGILAEHNPEEFSLLEEPEAYLVRDLIALLDRAEQVSALNTDAAGDAVDAVLESATGVDEEALLVDDLEAGVQTTFFKKTFKSVVSSVSKVATSTVNNAYSALQSLSSGILSSVKGTFKMAAAGLQAALNKVGDKVLARIVSRILKGVLKPVSGVVEYHSSTKKFRLKAPLSNVATYMSTFSLNYIKYDGSVNGAAAGNFGNLDVSTSAGAFSVHLDAEMAKGIALAVLNKVVPGVSSILGSTSAAAAEEAAEEMEELVETAANSDGTAGTVSASFQGDNSVDFYVNGVLACQITIAGRFCVFDLSNQQYPIVFAFKAADWGGDYYVQGEVDVDGTKYYSSSQFTCREDFRSLWTQTGIDLSVGTPAVQQVALNSNKYKIWGTPGGGNTVTCSITIADPNLALGKTTGMSSTWNSYASSRAVDGSSSSSLTSHAAATASTGAPAYWWVDLGCTALIREIQVFNVKDVPEKLWMKDFTVSICTSSACSDSDLVWSQFYEFGVPYYDDAYTSFTAGESAQGRFVKIAASEDNRLALAEVKVFGRCGKQTTVNGIIRADNEGSVYVNGKRYTYTQSNYLEAFGPIAATYPVSLTVFGYNNGGEYYIMGEFDVGGTVFPTDKSWECDHVPAGSSGPNGPNPPAGLPASAYEPAMADDTQRIWSTPYSYNPGCRLTVYGSLSGRSAVANMYVNGVSKCYKSGASMEDPCAFSMTQPDYPLTLAVRTQANQLKADTSGHLGAFGVDGARIGVDGPGVLCTTSYSSPWVQPGFDPAADSSRTWGTPSEMASSCTNTVCTCVRTVERGEIIALKDAVAEARNAAVFSVVTANGMCLHFQWGQQLQSNCKSATYQLWFRDGLFIRSASSTSYCLSDGGYSQRCPSSSSDEDAESVWWDDEVIQNSFAGSVAVRKLRNRKSGHYLTVPGNSASQWTKMTTAAELTSAEAPDQLFQFYSMVPDA